MVSRNRIGARDLRRKQSTKRSYDRILIVCEGEKTEKQYFEEIRIQKRIPTLHIHVLPSAYGTAPRQVLDFAIDKFKETKAYEYVFAVFDRDEHKSFSDTLERARSIAEKFKNDEGDKVKFLAIPSVPCFELWFLLHFENVQAFIERKDLIRKLKNHLPKYEKSLNGMYRQTENLLHTASQRAQHLRKRAGTPDGTRLYTNVDEVVTKLSGMRQQ
jgi:hypothetical protein